MKYLRRFMDNTRTKRYTLAKLTYYKVVNNHEQYNYKDLCKSATL